MKFLLLPMITIGLMGCDQSAQQLQNLDNLNLADSSKLHTLAVNLSSTTDEGGIVRIELHQENDQILEERNIDMSEFSNPIMFQNLKGGYYSVHVYQDIDNNGQLTMAGVVPQEPLGFSNNPILQGPPTFAMIGFEVTENNTQEIQMIDYRY
ncbi:DUF2141 domain-containing protein [Vibrio lamellibrachiae]|uniref:DUF2141 domain-containing protein n=1 Tax=Vibrio lamellibrachiae TaxID=2910253 RepID=UPI003D12F3F9